jgi:hypothetical protein
LTFRGGKGITAASSLPTAVVIVVFDSLLCIKGFSPWSGADEDEADFTMRERRFMMGERMKDDILKAAYLYSFT